MEAPQGQGYYKESTQEEIEARVAKIRQRSNRRCESSIEKRKERNDWLQQIANVKSRLDSVSFNRRSRERLKPSASAKVIGPGPKALAIEKIDLTSVEPASPPLNQDLAYCRENEAGSLQTAQEIKWSFKKEKSKAAGRLPVSKKRNGSQVNIKLEDLMNPSNRKPKIAPPAKAPQKAKKEAYSPIMQGKRGNPHRLIRKYGINISSSQ